MESRRKALLKGRHMSGRGQEKPSTGDGPLFVDAKLHRLELNPYKTKARNNRPWLREWSYTLGFNCRMKYTAIIKGGGKDRSRGQCLSMRYQ